MARTPDGLTARTRRVTFRITEDDEDRLDALRGLTSRSDYIRNLITADHMRRRARAAKKEKTE